MPRIKEQNQDDVQHDANAESNGETKRVMRPRRPAPEGVTLGLLEQPEPVEAPPEPGRRGGRGRSVSSATKALINALNSNPGQWYKVGVFMPQTPPTEKSALGSHGFEFRHQRNDNGTFTRYASKPVAPAPEVPSPDSV